MFDNFNYTMSVLIVGECVSRSVVREFVGNERVGGHRFTSWKEKQYICKKSIDENLQQYIGNHR